MIKKTKKYNVIAFISIFILAIGLFFGISNIKVNASSINKLELLQGGVLASDGTISSSSIRIRSDYLSVDLTTNENYYIQTDISIFYDVFYFDYNYTYIRSSNYYYTENQTNITGIYDEPETYYYVIIVFKNETNSDIDPADLNVSLIIGEPYFFKSETDLTNATFGNTSTTAATWGNLYIDDFRGYWDIEYFQPGGTGVLFKMETPSEKAGAKREIILYIDYSFQDPDIILQFRDNNIKLDNIYIYSGGSGNWNFATANNELNVFMQSTNTIWTVVDYWGNFLTEEYPYSMPFYSFGSIVATIICNNNIPGVDPTILTNQNNFNNIPDLTSADFHKTTEQGDEYYMAWGGWYYDGAYTLPVKRTDLVGKQEYNIYGKWTNEWMNGWTIGHKEGSNIDIDDYIKKSDGTSWITAFFGAFSSFFAIKLGSVSLGAIILIPVSISVVWFVIKLFRGGS